VCGSDFLTDVHDLHVDLRELVDDTKILRAGRMQRLIVGVSFDSPEAMLDPVTARKEELHKLDLHPRDYIVYAYNAVNALAEHLMQPGGSA